MTYDRKTRKDAFYYYKSQWSKQKFVYITSRRWTHRTNPLTTVKVYSNAPKVTLRLNGAPVGTQTSDDHIFTWPITLRPGANSVTAVAATDTRSDSHNGKRSTLRTRPAA